MGSECARNVTSNSAILTPNSAILTPNSAISTSNSAMKERQRVDKLFDERTRNVHVHIPNTFRITLCRLHVEAANYPYLYLEQSNVTVSLKYIKSRPFQRKSSPTSHLLTTYSQHGRHRDRKLPYIEL